MDNLTRLQAAVSLCQKKLYDTGYNYMVEVIMPSSGGMLVHVFNPYDMEMRFALAWVFDFDQREFDAMLDYISTVFNDDTIDLNTLAMERSYQLSRDFNSLRILDPALDKDVERFERERDEYLKQRNQPHHVV